MNLSALFIYRPVATSLLTLAIVLAGIALVPKLLLGNPVSEAPASRVGKLELPRLHSQAGAWERANPVTLSEFNILNGSTKDTKSYIVEFFVLFVLFVSFVDKKL